MDVHMKINTNIRNMTNKSHIIEFESFFFRTLFTLTLLDFIEKINCNWPKTTQSRK